MGGQRRADGTELCRGALLRRRLQGRHQRVRINLPLDPARHRGRQRLRVEPDVGHVSAKQRSKPSAHVRSRYHEVDERVRGARPGLHLVQWNLPLAGEHGQVLGQHQQPIVVIRPRDGELNTSKRTSARVLDVLACCPPGPPLAVKNQVSSSRGIEQLRETRKTSLTGTSLLFCYP